MSTLLAVLEAVDLEIIYRVIGGLLFVFSLITLADRDDAQRWSKALFTALYGATFAFASFFPPAVTGICVVLMVAIVVLTGIKPRRATFPSKERRTADAASFGLWLFSPFFLSCAFTLLLYGLWDVPILPAFGVSNIAVSIFSMPLMRESPISMARDGQRIFAAMGWAAILPQLLAALGEVFVRSGVDDVILEMVGSLVSIDNRLTAVAAYCISTALFSMIMGNAFPAFIVVSSGIGIPLVVQGFGADPAVAGIIAMTSGYCGTLMTPLAMNFNTLPAELLEIRNMNAVLKVQAGIALPLLLVNIALMYFLA
mgnify:CR=1 FL=1